jgi:AraC-like DNA-binding protein
VREPQLRWLVVRRSEDRVQVAEAVAGDGWWQVAGRAPAPVLRGAVHRYLGYREYSPVPLPRRVVPTGRASLIVSFGPGMRVRDATGVRTLHSVATSVGARWGEVEFSGEQYGVQVDLDPLAAGTVLGTRLGELAGGSVELADALGAEAARLAGRLAEAPGWAARFDLLDAFLTARLAGGHPPSPSVAWACARLAGSRGRVPVAALAEQLGCSRRHLSGQVSAHLGIPPKTLARVLRVRHAIELLDRPDVRPALAEVAARCGYADQAHLGRDFREITGSTPGGWRPLLLPDGTPGTGATA